MTNPSPELPPSPPARHHHGLPDIVTPVVKVRTSILAHLRSIFITGLITIFPLFITIYILAILYGLVTKFTAVPAAWIATHVLAPVLGQFLAPATLILILTPIVAVLISVAIVYGLGLAGSFFIGRQILARFEHFIENLPLIKGIYGTTKQVIGVFRQGGGGSGFQRVVLVEFPRLGTWTLAFVTNSITDETLNRKLLCCFIPMTPNPTSGFFQMFPEDQVRDTDWTVDTGIKIVLSGGLIAPSHIGNIPTPQTTTPIA
jgi:uncharacterized membrane protein